VTGNQPDFDPLNRAPGDGEGMARDFGVLDGTGSVKMGSRVP